MCLDLESWPIKLSLDVFLNMLNRSLIDNQGFLLSSRVQVLLRKGYTSHSLRFLGHHCRYGKFAGVCDPYDQSQKTIFPSRLISDAHFPNWINQSIHT